MIVDVHTHIFPDSVAFKAVPTLAAEAGIHEAIDGRLSSLVDSMDRSGIDVSWIQPVATKPQQLDTIHSWMEQLRSDRLVPFGAFHPDHPDLPGLVKDLSRRGFPGIKIHPEYQKIKPDDPRLFPMYEALIEERMIVLYHTGLDIGIPTLNSTPAQFAAVIRQFPGLRLILAHLGGFQQWDEVETHLCGLDVYMDVSYVFGHLPEERFVQIVRRHGIDRILFGTDSPWVDQKQELDRLRRLPFAPEERERLCGGNAVRLLETRQ